MPFFFAVFIFITFIVIKNAMNKAEQQAKAQAQRNTPPSPAQRPAMQQTSGRAQVFNLPQQQNTGRVYDDGKVFTKPVPKAVPVEKSREQLAEEARRIAEAITGKRFDGQKAPGTKSAARQAALKNERPLIKHEEDDCGGGSIHDGYHEGVSANPFGEHKPRPAVAGNLGKRLADEDNKAVPASYDNAQRIVQKISKLPPLTQGIVYSEILGKPKSELG